MTINHRLPRKVVLYR